MYAIRSYYGILLPAISLGLWHNFGNVDNQDTATDIVLNAFDKGVTHFDLANNYGPPPGSAEVNRITSYNVCYTKLLRLSDGQGAA